MRYFSKCLLLVIWCGFFTVAAVATPLSDKSTAATADTIEQTTSATSHNHDKADHSIGHEQKEPALWSVLPFAILLIMIATGPILYPHIWHKYYPLIAVSLGTITAIYYIFVLHDYHHPIHSLSEYLSFIALLTALFVASGGILIKVDTPSIPKVNVALLVIGSLVANFIGTTGASMVLIRPFIRVNQDRIKPYHVVFFIFMVSNVGGCLTPIGDPPLFLGFLKGVPFFWTLKHIWLYWIFGIGLLSLLFYYIDLRNYRHYMATHEPEQEYSGKVSIAGTKNLTWLGITIAAVFIDPNVYDWVPAIHYHGAELSYVREIIMFITAFLSYHYADEGCLRGNEFDFEPIREVGYLFIGIFATMMPALHLISNFANSPTGQELVNVHSLYWATGSLSGILDNAPTYLNFLAAGMGKFGLEIGVKEQVVAFTNQYPEELLAISVSSVFFGAFTYIGNAPNFMVKSIAEQIGIEMPSFMGYTVKYSFVFLLPILLLTWLTFFVIF